jgi:phospholipase/carboxylesterase
MSATLVLLFHGVGSSAADLAPLAEAIAAALPQATVRCIQAPDASDFGRGWQWFSVQGISEGNRPQRVADAMQRFAAAIAAEQARVGADPASTVLVGFSQGAIMSLESTLLGAPPAARVVAIAGRFARLPERGLSATIHLVHGTEDVVVPPSLSRAAHERLVSLGTPATIDLIPGAPHGITAAIAGAVTARLKQSSLAR